VCARVGVDGWVCVGVRVSVCVGVGGWVCSLYVFVGACARTSVCVCLHEQL